MRSLNEKISSLMGEELQPAEVPAFMLDNLRSGYGRRPYQLEAFNRFVFYFEHPDLRTMPTQLLFHMATGSGKTLVMAGCILYLYHKGYRNFIFFVNSTNIIEKTRSNFLNPAASKYLFGECVTIGEQQVRIREVANFDEANDEDINIVFSTIQGLHSRLNTPKENAITYNDFDEKKMVLISDEAHHINAETKRGKMLNREATEEAVSWEGTVRRIFEANRENVLLEFTATADLSDPETGRKYKDKLLFDYPLKQFRADGYSKEVKVLQADLPVMERALQAVLMSQYRRKVFEKNHIPAKPVILFKSASIKDSGAFQQEFLETVRMLKPELLRKIGRSANDSLKRAFTFFDDNNISVENLAIELRNDFAAEKCISVNSKDESEAKQIAVNTLEDASNEYRAVFAVDKLNEGWDVLNLFDIVRLYDTRDASKGNPGKTTMSEAQLIGRGARYYPFILSGDHSPFLRKFDNDIENELRVCEELYYHSAYNPRYIAELNSALQEIGIKEKATLEIDLKLKDCFKHTAFYKTGFVFLNEQKKADRTNISCLSKVVLDTRYKASLKRGTTKISDAFGDETLTQAQTMQMKIRLISLGVPVIRKAMDRLAFFRFSNIKGYLPNLNSIMELITSENYLDKIQVAVQGTPEQEMHLSQDEKLEIAIQVLQHISEKILAERFEFNGTKEFRPFPIIKKLQEKKLKIAIENEKTSETPDPGIISNDNREGDYQSRDWMVFEDHPRSMKEICFIRWFDKFHRRLQPKFSDIYLIRNDGFFKFYNYQDGKSIEPCLLLFMTMDEGRSASHYQILIDIRSGNPRHDEEWKTTFLNNLAFESTVRKSSTEMKYRVAGISVEIEEFGSERLAETFLKLLQ